MIVIYCIPIYIYIHTYNYIHIKCIYIYIYGVMWSRPEMDNPCKVDSCLRHWPVRRWSLLSAVVPPDADWFVSEAPCLKPRGFNTAFQQTFGHCWPNVENCIWKGQDAPFYLGDPWGHCSQPKRAFPCLDYKANWHHNVHDSTFTPFHSASSVVGLTGRSRVTSA